MRLLLHLCCFLAGISSYGISVCKAFSLKKPSLKKMTAKSKTTIINPILSSSDSSFPPSPSCVGRLSIINNQIIAKDINAKTLVNYHVIGTSHFRCDSYNEVSDLIRQIKPDGVVIELDPERLLRLTLDDAHVRTSIAMNMKVNAMEVISKRWLGGDFLSAIETSKELNIPLFLGDEYPAETKQRFADTVFDGNSYNPQKLLKALQSSFRARVDRTMNNNSKTLFVDIVGTFLEDPQKILPLVAVLSLPLLTVMFTNVLDATASTATEVLSKESLLLDQFLTIFATLMSLLISFFASCKVFNNLIADRDVVLASNAQRAVTTMFMLKSNQLIRKRWTFGANKMEDGHTLCEKIADDEEKSLLNEIPLFTLKNPLEQNAIRNLNLFEARWLKMIDRLLATPQPQQPLNGVSTDANSGGQRLIGCVTCTNKFYSAINLAEDSQDIDTMPFIEGRYADVIFRRRGRFGALINVTEGSRPSGARKVGAKILGKDSFNLSSSKDGDSYGEISVAPEGYLTASNLIPINENEIMTTIEAKDIPDEINIVVVVGLLHANGVLECLRRSHESATSIGR